MDSHLKAPSRMFWRPFWAAPIGLFARLRKGALFILSAGVLILTSHAGGSATAAESHSAQQSCAGPVTIAQFAWDTAQLAAELAAITLRDGYGCDVALAPAAPDPAVQAIANAPKAETIIVVDAPSDRAALESIAQGAPTFGGAEHSGWFVPEWLADAHPELSRAADLSERPEIFVAEDATPARPLLHICPAAWPCHARDLERIETLDLRERFDIVIPASGEALTAALIDAWERRRPWVGSYWSPSTTVARYPMTPLKGAAHADADETRGDARTALYPSDMAERAPRIAAFLNRFSISPDAAHEALAWRAETNGGMADAARRLMQMRPALWRGWVDETAAARLSATLSNDKRARAKRPVEPAGDQSDMTQDVPQSTRAATRG